MKQSSNPLPVIASEAWQSSTPLPVIANKVKQSTPPLPVIANEVKQSSTPLPVIANKVKQSRHSPPVIASEVKQSSPLLPSLRAKRSNPIPRASNFGVRFTLPTTPGIEFGGHFHLPDSSEVKFGGHSCTTDLSDTLIWGSSFPSPVNFTPRSSQNQQTKANPRIYFLPPQEATTGSPQRNEVEIKREMPNTAGISLHYHDFCSPLNFIFYSRGRDSSPKSKTKSKNPHFLLKTKKPPGKNPGELIRSIANLTTSTLTDINST